MPLVYDIEVDGNHNFFANGVLVSNCYVRRTRKEVRPGSDPLPPIVVPVEISNRKEYDWAEKDFLDWLEANKGWQKVASAQNAEALVRMGQLRQLAAVGKLPATAAWLKEFANESDEKLIAFAHHRDVQAELKRICEEVGGTVAITGGMADEARHHVAAQFQNAPSVRFCVASIGAASASITLDAASVTVHVEFDWNPGRHLQAESRAESTAEDATPTQSYYMQADRTIDEDMVARINRKALIVNATNQGFVPEETENAMLGSLVEGIYRRRGVKMEE